MIVVIAESPRPTVRHVDIIFPNLAYCRKWCNKSIGLQRGACEYLRFSWKIICTGARCYYCAYSIPVV